MRYQSGYAGGPADLTSIDPAILRRMPKRFPIRLPNYEQRVKILSLMLAHTRLDPTLSMETLARRTDGLSGSDLRETCRNAAMAPVREVMRENGASGKEGLEQARKDVSLIISYLLGVPWLTYSGLQATTAQAGRFRLTRLARVRACGSEQESCARCIRRTVRLDRCSAMLHPSHAGCAVQYCAYTA